MIEKLQAHYGFSRMPFGRDLAPGMLHRHAAHNEAVARIAWCISERSIGVITGEVGAGKTVSVRTVLAGLDPSRHTIIYLPNPMVGVRGIHEEILNVFGQRPSHLASRLFTQVSKALIAEREERGRTPVLVLDEAHLLAYEQLETIRMLDEHLHGPGLAAGLPARRPAHPAAHHEARRPGRPGAADRPALHHARHDPGRDRQLHRPPRHPRRPADQLFTEDAMNLIHSTGRGYPRAVNNLALQSLVAAFAAGKNLVDEAATRSAVTEVID